MEAAVWTLIAMQGAALFGILYFVAGQLHSIRRDIQASTQRLEERIRASEARVMARLDAHIERHAH